MKWMKLSLLPVSMVVVAFRAWRIDVADAFGRSDPSAAGGDAGVSTMGLKVDRLDPSADRIIPAGATLERVATGFTWLTATGGLRDKLKLC